MSYSRKEEIARIRRERKEANISTVREVTIEGEGKGTVTLVDRTLEIKKQLELCNSMSFDRIWVVFDKDDFNDFNEAIKKAGRLGFQAAWTNEAFELWYYLHFEYLDTGIGRKAYIEKIESILRKRMGDNNYIYKKGDSHFYEILQNYGNEDMAKTFAKRLRSLYTDTNYANHKPCTRVDLLVGELEHPEYLLHKNKQTV